MPEVGPSPLSPLGLTAHASKRLQQRGVARWFVDALLLHGRAFHDRHGAVLFHVDDYMRQQLKAELPPGRYRRAERCFDVYAVVADQQVITVARRTRRRFN